MKGKVFYPLLVGFFLADICAGQQPRLVLPLGHGFYVQSASFSPDNKKIVTSSYDKTAKIWDARTGLFLVDLIGHSGQLRAAVFSPDGRKVLTASIDQTAKIWDVHSGRLLKTLIGHKDFITDAAWDPSGKKIVTSSTDNTAKVWDAETGAMLFNLHGHTGFLYSSEFSNDGKSIVTASADSTAKLWSAKNGSFLFNLRAHQALVSSASFSSDNKKVLTISRDNTAIIWDATNGRLLHQLTGHTSWISSASFSPDMRKVITGSRDSTATIWDTESGTSLFTLKGHIGVVSDVNFSPDGKNVVTASWDSTARIWNVLTGDLVAELKAHTDALNSAGFSSDGKRIVTSGDYKAILWDAKSGSYVASLKSYGSSVESAVFSSDGKKIVSAYRDSTAKIWHLFNSELLHVLIGHEDWVNFSAFSPDAKKVVTVSSDGNPKIWNTENGRLLLNLHEPDHRSIIYFAAFSTDGKKIVTGAGDATARIWDAETGALLLTLEGHRDNIVSCFFSPDNNQVLTACWDSTARLWDANTGKMLLELRGHHQLIHFARFSPDGKTLMTASRDSSARLWDVKTGRLLGALRGKSVVYNCFFSPDNKRIFIASADGRIRVWNALTRQPIKTIKLDFVGTVEDISFITNKIIASFNLETMYFELETGKLLYKTIAFSEKEYIYTTALGYYKCTRNASKLLRYVTKDLKVINFEQLDVKYNRPDKVLEAIGNKDTALIKSYRKAWEKRIKKLGIDTTAFRDGYSVPEADVVNRDLIEYEQKTGTLQLLIKGVDSIYKLDRFNIWVNETPVFGQRGISLRKKNTNNLDTSVLIKLSQGENRIETSITNVNGTESYRMPLYVNYTPANRQKESLRFIGIGIDKFADPKNNLQYSSKDIRDLATKLKEKYKDAIIIDTLFNENVNVENVKALKQKLQQTTVNDKVILSYSGHGLLSKEYDYYLSTYAINFDKPEENGLPYDELENLLDSIPARKKLLLIDACHSGEVDKEEMTRIAGAGESLRVQGTKGVDPKYVGKTSVGMKNSFELMQSLFVNVGKSTGATVISAAAGTQFALERGDLKNGVFTYSLLEAMDKNPVLKISELRKIVGERVEQLTNGLQKPTSRNETIAVDWTL